jgi:hypothetical protein
VKELKLRLTVNNWYYNCSWYECNSMGNPCQTHVCKNVSRAGQPCPVRVSGHYDNQEKKITGFSTILEDLNSLVSISFPKELTSLA